MDILQLKLFVSIAHTLNFSRTAMEFYTTQPSVSHHIRALENRLGVKLLQRNSHGVRLTREGEEFLPYAIQTLDLLSEGERRVQNVAQGMVGRIRIASLSSVSSELTQCLTDLYAANPLIQADIDLLEGADMINALTWNTYDYYFTVEPMIPAGRRFSCSTLSTEPLCLYVPNAWAETIDIDDWQTVQVRPFVSVPESDSHLSSQIRIICHNRGVTPHILNYYNRVDAVILSVNLGIGVAILPGPLRDLYRRPNVTAIPIPGKDAELTSAVAWTEPESPDPAFLLFRDIISRKYPLTEPKRHVKPGPHQ